MIAFRVVLQIGRAYGAASGEVGSGFRAGVQRRRREISVEPRNPEIYSPSGAAYTSTTYDPAADMDRQATGDGEPRLFELAAVSALQSAVKYDNTIN